MVAGGTCRVAWWPDGAARALRERAAARRRGCGRWAWDLGLLARIPPVVAGVILQGGVVTRVAALGSPALLSPMVVRIRLVRAGIWVITFVDSSPFGGGSPAWSPWQFLYGCGVRGHGPGEILMWLLLTPTIDDRAS